MARTIPDRLPPLPLPDLRGVRAVVTGASSGIGTQVVRALARAGASVVLGVRNPAKGEATANSLRAELPDARLEVEEIELGSLASIGTFAERVAASPVDLLINNAGLSASQPSETTQDGFDLQIGVNYLGSFALTAGLWPALRGGTNPRVVTLGSQMAGRGRITPTFGSPGESTYQAYSDSKLAQVVFATELQRRSAASGAGVTAVPAHPGWCRTPIFDTAGPPAFVVAVGRLTGAIQSPADGAQPILLAATAAHPASYYGPTRKGESAGPPGPCPLPEPARDPAVGDLLWTRTAELTGIDFQP